MDTQILMDKVYNWILTFGPRLLLAIVIVTVGLWFIGVIKRWLRKSFLKHSIGSNFRPFLAGLVASVCYVLLAVAVLQIMGLQMTIFAALLGAVGVAAGLALSGTMQNFTSGILILILKPFEVGDYIIAQNQTGKVTAIRIFYTEVLTEDNRTAIIPNSKLSNELIVNLNRMGSRRVDIELKLNYQQELPGIKTVIADAFRSVSKFLKNPEPKVDISSIDTDGYKIVVHGWVNAEDYDEGKSQLQAMIIDKLKQAGIKLPGMS